MRLPSEARGPAVLGGALGALHLVLLLGVVLEQLVLVAAGGIGVHVLEALLQRRLLRRLPGQQPLLAGEQHLRLLLADALVVVFLARWGELGDGALALVAVALAAHSAVRLLLHLVQLADERLRAARPELHNVPSPVCAPPPPSLLGEAGREPVAHAWVLVPVALALAGLTGRSAVVPLAAVAAVVAALAVVVAVAPGVVRLSRLPRGERLLRSVQDAVRELEPAVVLYSPGRPGAFHWVRPWLDTLEHLGKPALILLRHPGSVATLGPTTVPVACLPEGGHVRSLGLPERCVVLYVANALDNLPLLKNPAVRSAFIGHGDSDKGTSASPASKVYDEVWVAGESGRQRYLEARVGVRDEDIRVVGRPQVRRVEPARRRPPGDPFTVLYAPTWEGPQDDPAVSSLLHSGRAIVTTLLATEGVRVLYRPHPATGNVRPAFAEVSRSIGVLLAEAGPQHAVVPPRTTDLYDCFNDADAMIADRSGVVSDFLASDKPYVIVNGSELSHECFRERNPSTGGAYLIGTGGTGLVAALQDARGPDTMQERRREVRTWLIGPPTTDPVKDFVVAVEALAAKD